MGGSKKQTVGYRYFIGLHMGFCHGPVDFVREVKVADKLAWPTGNDVPQFVADVFSWSFSTDYFRLNGRPPSSAPDPVELPTIMSGVVNQSGKIYINNPNLFGGEEREGGISGYVHFHFGGQDEPRDTYLQKILGSNIPAFRGVLSAVAEQTYVAAMNPYIKGWSIYATRTLAQFDGTPQWYPTKATIQTFDMNPAHIIRECLTNQIWGKGQDGNTDIDDASFRYAADVLYNENFGLSFLWGDTRGVDEFVQTVCQHIDGAVYQDRITNKWKLKLGRNDYVAADLPIFDENNILSIEDLGRPLPSEVTNQVTLTYWNRETRKNDFIVLDNQSLQDSINGRINPNDIDRTGISRTDLAQRVAARELRALGTSLLTGRITVNRDGLKLAMAECFKLKLPSRDITEVICRITNINFGSLESSGIVLSFVEDVFALPESTYLGSNPTLWEDPRKQPQISPYRYFKEAPYWTVYGALGPSGYTSLSPTGGVVALSGSRQSADTFSMGGYVRQGGGAWEDAGNFGAAAVARVPLGGTRQETSTVIVDQVVDDSQIVYGTYAAWDDELVMVLDYRYLTGALTLARGVLDTVPQAHAANSRILFIENHQIVHERQFFLGESAGGKIITQTPLGRLPAANAPEDVTAIQARHYRPYAPGRLRITGLLYPTDIYGVDPAMAWAHRSRTQQTAYIVQQGEGNIGPETGVTYTVRVKNLAGSVLRTVTGLSASTASWSYTDALAIADGALQNVTFEVFSVRDGYSSWQSQSHSVIRHGLGFQLGMELGGVAA